jgi:hypothetical protein
VFSKPRRKNKCFPAERIRFSADTSGRKRRLVAGTLSSFPRGAFFEKEEMLFLVGPFGPGSPARAGTFYSASIKTEKQKFKRIQFCMRIRPVLHMFATLEAAE